VSAPDIISSSTALSWPHGTEFADSYLKLRAFSDPSLWLSCDGPDFCRFFEDIPFALLQRLADVDYRKLLIAGRMVWELEDSSDALFFGIRATAQTSFHTAFECVCAKNFHKLDFAAFVQVCFNYDYLK